MNHCDTVGALTSVAVRDWRGSYSLGLRTLKARVACAGGLVNGDGNCAEWYPALSLMLSSEFSPSSKAWSRWSWRCANLCLWVGGGAE